MKLKQQMFSEVRKCSFLSSILGMLTYIYLLQRLKHQRTWSERKELQLIC